MERPLPRRHCHPGFTLVELLIAALVMVLSTIGGTTLFNQATRHGIQTDRRLREQFVISEDLAAILEINERYRCSTQSGGCQASLADPVNGVLPPPPGQAEYAPADIDAPLVHEGGASFRELCDRGLLTHLVAAIGTKNFNDPDVGADQALRIDAIRTVTVLDASSPDSRSIPPHRYRVDWKDSQGTLLRQVQLIPTVAAWCP